MRVIPKKTSRITEVIKSQIAENLKAYIMVSIILLDSGIWKAISFALLVVVFVALGYKDILHLRDNEEENLKIDESNNSKGNVKGK